MKTKYDYAESLVLQEIFKIAFAATDRIFDIDDIKNCKDFIKKRVELRRIISKWGDIPEYNEPIVAQLEVDLVKLDKDNEQEK